GSRCRGVVFGERFGWLLGDPTWSAPSLQPSLMATAKSHTCSICDASIVRFRSRRRHSLCWKSLHVIGYRDMKAFEHRHVVSFAYHVLDDDVVVGRGHYPDQGLLSKTEI